VLPLQHEGVSEYFQNKLKHMEVTTHYHSSSVFYAYGYRYFAKDTFRIEMSIVPQAKREWIHLVMRKGLSDQTCSTSTPFGFTILWDNTK